MSGVNCDAAQHRNWVYLNGVDGEMWWARRSACEECSRSGRISTTGMGYSKAIRGRDGSPNQVQAKRQNGTEAFQQLSFYK
jgi:hypothetical protein